MDVAHHPGRARDRRELALLEPGVPLRGERGQRGRLAGLDRGDRLVVGLLHGGVRRQHDVSLLVVEPLRGLRDDRVEHVAAGVEPLHVRRLGHELLAGVDVGVPARQQGRDLVPVGGQAGRLEQVGPVAQRETADVGTYAEQRLAVGARGRLPLGLGPLVLVHPVVEVVHELRRLRAEPGDLADLDRLEVGGTGTGEQVRLEVLVVVGVGGDVLLDRDVRVRLLVLGVQVLVSEVAEQVHGQRDLLVRRTRAGRTLAAPCEQ